MAHMQDPQQDVPQTSQQDAAIDDLVSDFQRNRVSRRAFIQRSVALGLSLSAASALLAACGGGSSNSNSVDVLNVWSGTEQESFKATVAPFTQQTGITVKVESTRDLNAQLTTRIRGNNPPDIAILPNPGKMQELAQQGKLIALDGMVDMNQIHSDYASAWTDLGSYNGKLYAIFYKAANKGTVWYNPKSFTSGGYSAPATWQDMLTLSDKIANANKYPWSMGVESGSSSGWPAADWIAQIYLNNSGPDMYDKWVNHTILWTDPSIKQAFQMFGQIAAGKHYIQGAPQSILATNFTPSTYGPFQSPPTSYMVYLGDFAAGFISAQFKSLTAGTDFNFFPFPTVNSQYQGAVTGGADVVVAMKNTEAVKKLVAYLATASAQEIWVKRGGFTSVNKSVTLDAYPDAIAKASAQMLTAATTFRFGADDLMPSAVENAFWQAMLNYIQHPDQLDSILSSMESTAASAYQPA